MSIAIQRIKRAIADMPTGGMQTGKRHTKLEYSDAQRAITEIEGLTAERDALAAQGELLSTWLKVCASLVNQDAGTAVDWLIENHVDMERAAEAAPVACLAQVQAEAGRKGYAECALDFGLCSTDEQRVAIVIRADEYAESIRQGGAQ